LRLPQLLPQGARCAVSGVNTPFKGTVIDPVETGFPGQPECGARRNVLIPAGETRETGRFLDGRDPTGKFAGLRLMRSQGPA
jgi:hypothetical protein